MSNIGISFDGELKTTPNFCTEKELKVAVKPNIELRDSFYA